MLAALFAALFSGITPVVASRGIGLMGFVRANIVRLAIAVVVLGVWAFAFGQGLRGQALLFFSAGAIGFGLGGLAFLAALPRLGAPLTSLVEETLAAVVAAAVAWVAFSDKITANQVAISGIILVGVVIGLVPYVRQTSKGGLRSPGVAVGIGLAVLASIGQGVSFATTRYGLQLMKKAGTPPDVITVAFQRLCGGLVVALIVYALARWVWQRRWGFVGADGTIRSVFSAGDGKLTSRPLFWGSLNALLGPILSVTSTVWAQQTLNAGVVQSIVALAPMISVPFAFWLLGHRPPRLWYLGAAVSILGLVLLNLNS
jgi:drug/metabolite transporter (DMT)-like permease